MSKPLYIVMLGAPGAGKGTQARLLSEVLAVPQVSSGNIFRENLKYQTRWACWRSNTWTAVRWFPMM